MNVYELINYLKERKVNLSWNGEKFKVDAPAGVLTPELKSLLKERKDELVNFFESNKKNASTSLPIRKSDKKELALSFTQERLWFIDQFEGGSAHYNMPAGVRLQGAVNISALTRALETIVMRHQSLRTVFSLGDDNRAIQKILEDISLEIPIVDLSTLSEAERKQSIGKISQEESSKAFNLSSDLMLRAKILKLAEDDIILLMTMHHIASDGWSMTILVKEFNALYEAYCQAKENPLPPLAVQYADYAQWQREYLTGETLDQHVAYWQKQLADIPVVHNLALDYPRPSQQTFRGAALHSSVKQETYKAFNSLCQKQGATLFMGLHAAFSCLLSRYSNENDIVIGTPIANREQAEVANLIGFFTNTLVLRSNLSDDPNFIDLLQQSKTTALSAYAHQQMPFEKLVDVLKPERSLSHNPIFQISLALQNNDNEQLQVSETSLSGVMADATTAKFELALSVTEAPAGLFISWEYNTDLFQEATIARMAEQFSRLLDEVILAPEARLSLLPLISEEESQQLLAEWSSQEPIEQSGGSRQFIHQLIEAKTEENPDALALVFESESLSYESLNARANQLAHYLVEQGVKPNDIVGVYLERSIDMMLAILGVLKAGAAYLPLDPNYPAARIDYMLNDATPRCLLTCDSISSRLSFSNLALSDDKVFCLDSDSFIEKLNCQQITNIDPCSLGNVDSTAKPTGLNQNDLAYVIYTSGSTGKPKGVLVEHKGLCNLVEAQTEAFKVDASAKVLQFASISFDAAVSEWAMALCSGSCLLLPSPHIMKEPKLLDELVAKHSVTHATVPPALLPVLDEGCWSSVRSLIVAGESCPLDQARRWSVGRDFYNAYGPTEATVCASIAKYENNEELSSLHIGRPIQNVELYVLDEQLNLAPIGVCGELYIGGIGLARGYLNQAILNKEKFIRHPFSSDPQAKLYKTGDLARWLNDGNLEFRGRIDHQVKIRGYRIELGEINALLSQHEMVNESFVLDWQDSEKGLSTNKSLVAYVVLMSQESDEQALTQKLRTHLSKALPEYMIPSVFIFLDALPLTNSGKIDRKALPSPQSNRAKEDYVAPKTETEKSLCAIWQSVLGVEQVGIYDNFFALGGDSIISIQVVAKAAQQGLEFSSRQLFEHQSVAQLALVVKESSISQAEQNAINGDMLLLPIQKRFFRITKEDQHHFNQSIMLVPPKLLDDTALQNLVKALYQRHDALRLRYQQSNDGDWQANFVALTSEMVRQSVSFEKIPQDLVQGNGQEKPSAEYREQLNSWLSKRGDEIQASLDLMDGPLFRAVFFKGERDQRLLLVAHHLVVDGVSWRILLSDLELAYQQLGNMSENKDILLAAKTHSYKAWGESIASPENKQRALQEKEYWLAQHKVIPSLPVDYKQNSQALQATTKRVAFSLTEKETEQLLKQCHHAYHTQINDLLLAGLYLGLKQWSGLEAFRISLESHGRDACPNGMDVTQTLGWFTTIHPLLLESESAEIGDVIKNIKEQLRSTPNDGVNYGVLRELCDDSEFVSTADSQVAEIVFNYLGQFDQVLGQETAFGSAAESTGALYSGRHQRDHRLGLNGLVANARLSFSIDFSEDEYEQKTMAELADAICRGLQEIITHCYTKEVSVHTVSDFPLADVSSPVLDEWQNDYPKLEKLYRATPMQEGLLFHSMMESSAYVTQMSVTLGGKLQSDAFQSAWRYVLSRHDIFRTAFVGQEEKIHQLVVSEVSLPWQEYDWSDMDAENQEQRFGEYSQEDKNRGFVFGEAPLMRLTLFRVSDTQHKLLWSHHHALLDGWSLPLVFRDVVLAYEAFVKGEIPALPDAPNFARYIAWLAGQNRKEGTDFWRENLSGIESSTPLGIDKMPDIDMSLSNDSGADTVQVQTLVLNKDDTAALKTLASQSQTTVNVAVQLAWAYLLNFYSGESDVVFGATISGRPGELAGVEDIVGLFINSVPVRATLNLADSVQHHMQTLHEQSQLVNQYGYIALNEIQNLSGLVQGQPLFESLLVFENYPVEAALQSDVRETSLQIEKADTDEQTNYPLTIKANVSEQLIIDVEYMRDEFAGETIDRLVYHLKNILLQLPSSLDSALGDVDVLTGNERDAFSERWNAGVQHYARAECIQEIFEAQVEKNPDGVAIRFDGLSLSYEELNSRANRLARYLIEQGLSPDTFVGICLERSAEMVMSILAVLKAGGAYIPLDPHYPETRIQYMIEDSGLNIVLTESTLFSDTLDKGLFSACKTICLDSEEYQHLLAQQSISNPSAKHLKLAANNLAYVIYTSGSTGNPKGVLVEHQNVTRLFSSSEQLFDFNEQDVWTLFHSYAFDFSVWEIWGALLHGGCLVVVPHWVTRSPDEFAQLIRHEKVTILNQTPSAFKPLADHVLEQSLTLPLRYVVFGGEALDPGILGAWFDRYGEYKHDPNQTRFVNMYGITETTVHVTFRELNADDARRAGHSSVIGEALPDLSVLVLNEKQQLLPVGVPGELYVGGGGVSRGYLGRDQLTRERFIPCPDLFNEGSKNGELQYLYRTGDKGRYLNNGELEYLGRLDQQVKVRGFRIELGEIEAVLNRHQSVKESIVLARDTSTTSAALSSSTTGLIAYVVTNTMPADVSDSDSTENHIDEELKRDIQSFMESALPSYMLPSAYVLLNKIPLTENGKVDYQSLPSNIEMSENYLAPNTDTEKLLCNIWQDVLGVEKVGLNDNFFSLGGDSILSIRIVSQAKKKGLYLSVRNVFEAPTVGLLVKKVNFSIDDEETQYLPFSLLNDEEKHLFENNAIYEDAYPLSELQTGMFYHGEVSETGTYFDISHYHLKGPWQEQHFKAALIALCKRHTMLRTHLNRDTKRPVQCVLAEIDIPLQVKDISQYSTEEQSEVIAQWLAEERLRGFSTDQVLFRVVVFERGIDEFEYAISCHHAALDGWSVAVFNQELFALYSQALGGQALNVAQPHALFRETVQLELAALSSEKTKQYWRDLLDDASPTQLPRREGYQASSKSNIKDVQVTEMSTLTAQMQCLSEQLSMPMQHILLAGHVKVLALISGQCDVLSCVVNNVRPETEEGDKILGLFLNSLPIRTKCLEQSWKALIDTVSQQAIDNLEHRHYPLSAIQRDSGLEFSEVVFNYTHFHVYEGFAEQENSFDIVSSTSVEETNFTLTVNFNLDVGGNDLSLVLSYDSHKLDDAFIEKMGGYYSKVFQSMLQDFEHNALNGLHTQTSLLSSDEFRNIVVAANETIKAYPEKSCIQDLFEEQVVKSPDAIALICGKEHLSYIQLNERANQLAHVLISRGLKPDDLVGVCLERSVEMLVATLAIMKAGGAYVPMDPQYPEERLAYMVEDAQLEIVITTSGILSTTPVSESKALCLDLQAEDIRTQAKGNPDRRQLGLNSTHLAYMIYTSGSTGQPKGVMIEHRNLVNFLYAMQPLLGQSLTDARLLAVTSLSFDIHTLELYLPLISGAQLILAQSSETASPDALEALMKEHQISVMQATPSLWQMMLDNNWSPNIAITVLCGGEALPKQLKENLVAFDKITLWNMYGPTETTVWSSVKQLSANETISLGAPIANTSFYVLDENLSVLPVGVAGELYIGGAGVARAYRGQEVLTQERFITSPFSPSERLYKTGDLVRWVSVNTESSASSLELEYLGRLDQQVKIRGFRIELGEIEAALSKCPGVKEVVVTASTAQQATPRLVAYWVAMEDQDDVIETESLARYLRQTLPEYMVPTAFMVLPGMPLTPNGKVDRKALPEPDAHSNGQEYVAPRNETETQLCELWQEVLGQAQVGIHDNFFNLGGHSVLAVRLANRIETTFERALGLRTFLSLPTVAEQASYLIEAESEQTEDLHRFDQVQPQADQRYEPFPLSEIQQAYWLGRKGDFELGNIGTHSYVEFPSANIDVELLQKTINRLIERHDMLRMVVSPDGQQRVLEDVPEYQIKRYDFSSLAEQEAEQELLKVRAELSHQVFDCDTWPLFDIRLSQFSEGRILLHYSMDMLVMDASSSMIIAREFVQGYMHPEHDLVPLSLTFRDYILAENALKEAPLFQKAERYWRERVVSFPSRPELPLAVEPSSIEHPRFERRGNWLNAEKWQSLKSIAQQHQVTPTVLLLSCFGEVLNRWSQQAHFALNLTLFNRLPVHPEVEQIVGDFTSLTLLEMDYRDTSLSFSERLLVVQEQLWNDLENRYFGGLSFQRALSQSQGQSASFPVVVTSTLGLDQQQEQKSDEGKEESNGNSAAQDSQQSNQQAYSITQTSQVWLDVQLSEAGGGLLYNWDSVEGLFPEGMLDDMFAAMANVLDTLAEEATAWQQPQLITLPEAQAAIVAEANATETAIAPALLHANLEQSITQYGSKTAVQSLSKALSYQELGERSDALACSLVAGGAQTNQLIAIVMEKGWEQIVAVLGILRSGAAYLPIDGSLPAERIALLLASGEVSQVITTAAYTDVLPAGYRVHVLDEAYVPASDTECLNTVATQPADLAYVIFTSGSTGQPKGVMIAHGPAHNTVQDINQRYGVTSDDRMLGMSNLSFDLSVYDIFGVLGAGGTLVLPQPEEYRDPQAWGAYLREEGITLWNTVPPLMQMLVDAEQIDAEVAYEDTVDVRLVLLSGDWIPTDLPGRIKRLAPSAEVISLGGATEASIWSISYPIDEVDPSWPSIPYGKALANQQFYVLKEDYSPAPLWVTGDLYIGGVGLAEGYWRDEVKTSASFVRHPETGERLYKTGDRGRLLADGNIEFKGRIDTQVKVQGYRIELGEIEAQLKRHEDVKDTVVITYAVNSSHQLVAYIVVESGSALDDSESAEEALRQYLAGVLPSYMVPSFLMFIDEIPLSANGKVDRKALVAPDVSDMADTYVAPESEIEAILCTIWQEILGLERVGVHDNFFALGGDSILSIQVVVKATEQGLGVTARQLFESQTIAQLAREVTIGHVVEVDQGPVEGALALLPIHRQFLRTAEVDPHYFNQSVLLTPPADFTVSVLGELVEALYQRHDALRVRYRQDEQGHWQATHQAFDQEMLAQSVAHETLPEGANLFEYMPQRCGEIQSSLNITEGPLLRAVYFEGAQEGRLLLAAHHLVVDGVSWRVILSDLEIAYAQLKSNHGVQLPAKTESYQRWSEYVWSEESRAQSQEEKAYWLAQHDVIAPFTTDYTVERAPNQASSRAAVMQLDAETTEGLLKHCHHAYHTQINDLLLAGVYLGLRAWSDNDAFRVSLESHGRMVEADAPDISQTVGWFTTVHPLLLSSGSEDVGEVIKRIKEQLRAIPGEGAGYGVLREIIEDSELVEAAEAQPAQLIFNYLGQMDQVIGQESDFASAKEPIGPVYSPDYPREHQLSFNGMVTGGCLTFTLDYSKDEYKEERINNLVDSLKTALSKIVEHCTAQEKGVYTPSDFPLAELQQSSLDKWHERFPDLENIYSATPMQEGLLLRSAMEQGAYVTQIDWVFRNPDISAMKLAWNYVANRHDIFRTAFVSENSNMQQVVLAGVDLSWYEEDWSESTAEQQKERFKEYQAQDRLRGFQMSEAPLMRMALFKLSEERYQLLWSHHHALLDGWSLPLVYRDVLVAYQSYAEQKAPNFEAIKPFSSYIAWLHEQDKQAGESFWREAVASIESSTPLGIDKLPAQESGRSSQMLYMDKSETKVLTELAKATQTTMNTLVQFTWAYLLRCYSAENQVVFGTTFSGRPADLVGVEDIVGLFINTVPIRVAFDMEQSLLTHLQELHRYTQNASHYSHMPLMDIQALSSTPNGQPMFESLLLFDNYPLDAVSKENGGRSSLEIESVSGDDPTSFKLTLVAQVSDYFSIDFQYRGEDFSDETIQRTIGHFKQILLQLPDVLHQGVKQLNILTQEEKTQLEAWNNSSVDYPKNVCLHTLFEQQAAKMPDKKALIFNDKTFTFDKLNRRANRFAHYLIEKGVQPGEIVAVYLERSIDMVVAWLASMKVGASYFALETDQPDSRVGLMLKKSAANALVVDRASSLASQCDVPLVIELKDVIEVFDSHDDENPGLNISADEKAYIIFTSGSTGQPKGVASSHRSIVNRCYWMWDEFPYEEGEVALQKTAVSFVDAVWETWGPLLKGIPLVLASADEYKDAYALFKLIKANKVSRFVGVPSLFKVMVSDVGEFKDYTASVKYWMTSGEALPASLAERLLELSPEARLLNLYGASEVTADVTCCDVKADDVVVRPPYLGKVIANVRAHIVDDMQRPVPIGIIGELYVSGEGVTSGYINNPELTADRFVRNESLAEGLLYRTGDLVRILPGGDIEYLGRQDDQVKIRGNRVELGEIQYQVMLSERVQSCAVVLREGRESVQHLVAYVMADIVEGSTKKDFVEQLRSELRGRLPAYMQPSFIEVLDEWPLLPNGKVNKNALPEPDLSQLQEEYVAPETEAEQNLVNIWAKLLKVDAEKIGVNDNFFFIGGNSLLALQFVAEARQVGLQYTAKQLLHYPDIRSLAKQGVYVEGGENYERVHGELPLTNAQAWFFYQDIHSSSWNLSLHFDIPIELEFADLERILHHVFDYHDALRSRFRKAENTNDWSVFIPEEYVPVPISKAVYSDEANGEDPNLWVWKEIEREKALINLLEDRLLSVKYIEVDSRRVLTLVIHHLLYDAYSLWVLQNDFSMAVQQVLSGETIKLPSKSASVKEVADWLSSPKNMEKINEDLSKYYRGQSIDDFKEIPLDYEPANGEVRTRKIVDKSITVDIGASTTALLRSLESRFSGATTQNIILFSITKTLCRVFDSSKLQVLVVDAGRSLHSDVSGLDVSRTVGWLTLSRFLTLWVEENDKTSTELVEFIDRLTNIPGNGLIFNDPNEFKDRDGRKIYNPPIQLNFNDVSLLDNFGQLEDVEQEDQISFGEVQDIQDEVLEDDIYTIKISRDINRLKIEWRFSSECFEGDSLSSLMKEFVDDLMEFVTEIRGIEKV